MPRRSPSSLAFAVTPTAILPQSYPIQFTQEFDSTFCHDPYAVPPAEVRKELWKVLVGKPQHERAIIEAKADAERRNKKAMKQYQQKCERHRQLCLEVEKQNELIRRKNEQLTINYAKQKAAHHAALTEHQRRYGGERLHKLKLYLRKRLELTIAGQEPLLQAIYRQSLQRSLRATICSTTFLLWSFSLSVYVGLAATSPLFAFLPALVSLMFWRSLVSQHSEYTHREILCLYDEPGFFTYCPELAFRREGETHTPVILARFDRYASNLHREDCSFKIQKEAGFSPPSLFFFLIACVPYLSAGVVLFTILKFSRGLTARNTDRRLTNALSLRRARLLSTFEGVLQTQIVDRYLQRPNKMPKPPSPPKKRNLRPLPSAAPSPPTTVAASLPPKPEPPVYDDGMQGNYTHTLRGSLVYPASEIAWRARQRIYLEKQLRPYWPFGGVPIPISDKESPHIACIGTTAAGKTTIMRMLMSALLPLTQNQVQRIVQQSPDISQRMPSSSHEWSRSFTYQAVVYNAKDESIPVLAALGFNPKSDLIILDPADERCFAWDICRDICDREDITQFADLLVPVVTKAEKNKDDVWDAQARALIVAVIISLRNMALAAGKEPAWTMRDLTRAFGTRERLSHILSYHDVPEEVRAQLIDLDGPQASSNYMSATRYISQFAEVGERWAEAQRLGRTISLKDWANNRPHSILLLPNTKRNPQVYGPLNRVFFKALADIVVRHEYSVLVDASGKEHVKRRLFFIDELGEAGDVSNVRRIMSEGRTFGARAVLGVHQLSQLRETYGTDGAETILGLCSYAALLKTGDPTTAKWESERIGDTLRAYEKKSLTTSTTAATTVTQTAGGSSTETYGTNTSYSKGTTKGNTDTRGRGRTMSVHSVSTTSNNESHSDSQSTTEQHSEGTSWQHANGTSSSTATGTTHSETKGVTHSQDYRQEAATYYGEFLNLPDAETTGHISGYFVTPAFPVWRADIPFSMLSPRFESPLDPNANPKFTPWKDQERVSKLKRWTEQDYERLCLRMPRSERDRQHHLSGCEEREHGQLPAEFDS